LLDEKIFAKRFDKKRIQHNDDIFVEYTTVMMLHVGGEVEVRNHIQ